MNLERKSEFFKKDDIFIQPAILRRKVKRTRNLYGTKLLEKVIKKRF